MMRLVMRVTGHDTPMRRQRPAFVASEARKEAVFSIDERVVPPLLFMAR
jgi:hypothetical protein